MVKIHKNQAHRGMLFDDDEDDATSASNLSFLALLSARSFSSLSILHCSCSAALRFFSAAACCCCCFLASICCCFTDFCFTASSAFFKWSFCTRTLFKAGSSVIDSTPEPTEPSAASSSMSASSMLASSGGDEVPMSCLVERLV